METPTINEKGEYINCFGFETKGHTGYDVCTVLKDWYHRTDQYGNPLPHCRGCPFFKTKEEYEAGA